MRYTFGDAKRILASLAHSKMANIGLRINDAIRALCGANAWEHEFLRQVVRISSAGPVFTLPQGSAGLVRACVNGRPVTLHGQDFQFLSSGPGEFETHAGPWFRRLAEQEIEDLGMSPVWMQPGKKGGVLSATVPSDAAGQPPVTVHVVTTGGEERTITLTPTLEGAEPETSGEPVMVASVSSIVVDPCATKYVTIWLSGEGGKVRIAKCHPAVHVPEFRRYRVNSPHFHRHHGPCEILAEIQIDPLPLVDDDDVVPFPTLEPIKCMLLYQWNLQNNETAAAEKYLTQATSWLGRFNSSKNVMQTPTVMNVPYNMSMGELSNWCTNL